MSESTNKISTWLLDRDRPQSTKPEAAMIAFPELLPRLRLPQTCLGCSRPPSPSLIRAIRAIATQPIQPIPPIPLLCVPILASSVTVSPPFSSAIPASKSTGQQQEATNKAGRLPEVNAAARRPASVSLPAAVNQITTLTLPACLPSRLQATGHRLQQVLPCRPCLAYRAYLVTFPTTHLVRRESITSISLPPSFGFFGIFAFRSIHSTATTCPHFLIVFVISLRNTEYGIRNTQYAIRNTPSNIRTFAGECSLSFTRSLSAFDPLRSHVGNHSPPSFAPLPRGRSMINNHPN